MNNVSFAFSDARSQNRFLTATYGWMLAGLGLSALAAQIVAGVPTLKAAVLGNIFVMFGLVIIEFMLVIGLNARIRTMSVSSAISAYLGYSLVNGMTLSSVFVVYQMEMIAQCFFIAALLFGGMALWGMTTKRSLASSAHYFVMALWGIIVASLVNLIFKSSGLDWLLSFATVAIFVGLTAYDAQKIMQIAENDDGSDSYRKVSILAALSLYLDFVNLFLALLRIFGRKNRR